MNPKELREKVERVGEYRTAKYAYRINRNNALVRAPLELANDRRFSVSSWRMVCAIELMQCTSYYNEFGDMHFAYTAITTDGASVYYCDELAIDPDGIPDEISNCRELAPYFLNLGYSGNRRPTW